MTNTICGHGRGALILALEDLARLDNDTVAGLARLPEALPVWRNAVLDLIDPAKLAEMLAERGRELGLDVATYSRRAEWLSTKPTEWATFQTWHYTCDNNTERGLSLHSRDANGHDWTMPQARAILLRWLQLPDGAREETERVLRGDNGV